MPRDPSHRRRALSHTKARLRQRFALMPWESGPLLGDWRRQVEAGGGPDVARRAVPPEGSARSRWGVRSPLDGRLIILVYDAALRQFVTALEHWGGEA